MIGDCDFSVSTACLVQDNELLQQALDAYDAYYGTPTPPKTKNGAQSEEPRTRPTGAKGTKRKFGKFANKGARGGGKGKGRDNKRYRSWNSYGYQGKSW